MNKTIADIIREMRELSNAAHDKEADGSTILDVWSLLYNLADRIEKAYNYQRRDGSLCTMSCRESGELLKQYMEENKKLHEENKRLRAENKREEYKDFLYL